MSRRKTTPTIRIKHRELSISYLDGPLADTIKFLQDVFNSIPEEHRSTAYFDTETDEEFGRPVCSMTIFYDRPMTPEEIAADKAQRRQWSEAQLARDRAEFARLKAKLGE